MINSNAERGDEFNTVDYLQNEFRAKILESKTDLFGRPRNQPVDVMAKRSNGEIMESFRLAIIHSNGIINIRNTAINKEFKMPKQSTPIKDKSDKKSGDKKPMKK